MNILCGKIWVGGHHYRTTNGVERVILVIETMYFDQFYNGCKISVTLNYQKNVTKTQAGLKNSFH